MWKMSGSGLEKFSLEGNGKSKNDDETQRLSCESDLGDESTSSDDSPSLKTLSQSLKRKIVPQVPSQNARQGDESVQLTKDVSGWSIAQVKMWVMKTFKFNVASQSIADKFEEQEIDGGTLLSSTVKTSEAMQSLGLTTIARKGKFLEVLKELSVAKKTDTTGSPCTSSMKDRITKDDKKNMTEEQKHLYKRNIKIIRKECAKRWPGNTKIYFRGSNSNTLIVSEMVSALESTCAIEEIGFGKDTIRSHIHNWCSEKNRKITDGYDFERPHIPAKRSKKQNLTDQSQQIAPADAERPKPSDGEVGCGISHNIDEMSEFSAQIICCVMFNVPVFRNLSLKNELLPAAKVLGIKSRALGKYDLATKLAKILVKENYVTVSADGNFKELTRDDLTKQKDILEELPVAEVKHQTASTRSRAVNTCRSPTPSSDETLSVTSEDTFESDDFVCSSPSSSGE